MKLLVIDIEVSPNIADCWSLWNNNISLTQLRESAEVMCFASKWVGKRQVEYYSTFHDGQDVMLQAAHDRLSEADAVITYNGIKYDLPHLNREFVEQGIEPPAPYEQIDLLRTVRSQFRFPSAKLDYVCQTLNLGGKTGHSGHQLWVDCMAGRATAWAKMRSYNKNDVVLTERLYQKLLPWIKTHPSHGLYSGIESCCPACGSTSLQRRGYAYTTVSTFQRYQCVSCGKWSRGTVREAKAVIR